MQMFEIIFKNHLFFLLQESPPHVENYCLPEAISFLQNNKELGTGLSQKRKAPTEKNKMKRPRVH